MSKRQTALGLVLALALSLLPQGVTRAAAADSHGYIVKLCSDAAVPFSLPENAQSLGLGLYAVDELDDADALAGAGAVEFVEPNYVRTLFAGDLVTDPYYQWDFQWNLDAMDLGALWALTDETDQPLTGAGVTVAIVDTGLSPHEDLDPERMLPGHNSVDPVADTTDIHGHGTFVAGILAAEANNGLGMAGVAPEASVMPCMVCQVLPDGAIGADDAHIIDAIRWAADNGADVINLSMGSPDVGAAIETAVDYAADRGCIVIAAVGNDKTSTLNYPAGFENVIGVGALGEVVDLTAPRYKLGDKEKWAQYSNFNESVFLTAPGTQMCAPRINADGESVYDYPSGTSFAAPCVAGLAALCRQYDPAMTAGEFQNLLALTADDRGEAGWDPYYGHGAADAGAMAQALPARRIDYVLNGGSWDAEPETAFRTYQDDDVTFATPAREGYTFAGWYEDPDCAGQSVTALALPALAEDLTLYAAWLSDDVSLAQAALVLDGEAYPFDLDGARATLYLPAGTDLTGAEIDLAATDPDARAVVTPEPGQPGRWSVRVTAPSGAEQDYLLEVDLSVHAPALADGQEPHIEARVSPASADGLTEAQGWTLALPALYDYPDDDLVYTLAQLTVDGEGTDPEDLANLERTGNTLSFVPTAQQANQIIAFTLRAANAHFAAAEVTVTLTVGSVPADRPTPPTPSESPSPTPTPTPTPTPSPRPRPHLAAPLAAETVHFDDVGHHWAGPAILAAAQRGLLQGTSSGQFDPEGPADRAMVLFALRKLDSGRARGVATVGQNHQGLTREELATLLWRWAGCPQAPALAGFADLDQLSPSCAQAMAWCVQQGLIQGRPGGLLAPQAPALRSEAATVLYRLSQLQTIQ